MYFGIGEEQSPDTAFVVRIKRLCGFDKTHNYQHSVKTTDNMCYTHYVVSMVLVKFILAKCQDAFCGEVYCFFFHYPV